MVACLLGVLVWTPLTVLAAQPTAPQPDSPSPKVRHATADEVRALAKRHAQERAILNNLVVRVADAKHQLGSVAANADRWLVHEPLVLIPRVAPEPAKPGRTQPSPSLDSLEGCSFDEVPPTTAEEMLSWSKDLWDPEPLRDRWLAIRKQDEEGIAARLDLPRSLQKDYDDATDLQHNIEAAEANPNTMGLYRVDYYQRYHALVEKLSPWANPVHDFAVSIEQFGRDLDEAMTNRKHALCMLDSCRTVVVGPPKPAWQLQSGQGSWWYGLKALPGSGLGVDTATATRHRYAMSERRYIADDRKETPTTWPICDELYKAATDFDFWYRWATDQRWYGDSDRRLDAATWPRDAEPTHRLHEEFASVVLLKHRVLRTYRPQEEKLQESRWTDHGQPASPAVDLQDWTEDLRFLNHRPTLEAYFRNPDRAGRDRDRMPPLVAPPPGRLLPAPELK